MTAIEALKDFQLIHSALQTIGKHPGTYTSFLHGRSGLRRVLVSNEFVFFLKQLRALGYLRSQSRDGRAHTWYLTDRGRAFLRGERTPLTAALGVVH